MSIQDEDGRIYFLNFVFIFIQIYVKDIPMMIYSF